MLKTASLHESRIAEPKIIGMGKMANNDFINGVDVTDAGTNTSTAAGTIAADTTISGSVI